ncbi:hypothetical protein [Streptomyces prasinopilosus]|uniref:hypothetical protein n=1 Tax=Streptomyces prasinopilosus TaxID=67344 RepID=UPI003B8A7674
MVHNGIEYAMMQAYAEGWELLEKVDSVDNVREVFRSCQERMTVPSCQERNTSRTLSTESTFSSSSQPSA